MHFTREPIIETIISPREGYRLLVKNSKVSGGEEYLIDSIEVVSFGKSYFFRSKEPLKSFLVPVSDYEVLEFKETKVALKNPTLEKPIKIGPTPSHVAENEEFAHSDKRRKRPRRRKNNIEEKVPPLETKEEVEIPSTPRKLFPPPNMLIKERLSQFKTEEVFEDTLFPTAQEDLGFDEHVLPEPKAEKPNEDPS